MCILICRVIKKNKPTTIHLNAEERVSALTIDWSVVRVLQRFYYPNEIAGMQLQKPILKHTAHLQSLSLYHRFCMSITPFESAVGCEILLYRLIESIRWCYQQIVVWLNFMRYGRTITIFMQLNRLSFILLTWSFGVLATFLMSSRRLFTDVLLAVVSVLSLYTNLWDNYQQTG